MKHQRVLPTTEAETRFWSQGLRYVAGLDEAGRGAWAGPVYAAAVILPQDATRLDKLKGIRDSKTLSARQRAEALDRIINIALSVGIGHATQGEIDDMGIVPATRLSMRRALNALTLTTQALIIDALTLPEVSLPQDAFPYADAHSLSVAAAGIVAKVKRDRWMINIADKEFPAYGFARHKGYGTAQHRDALNQLGVCLLHRRSFRPVAKRIAEGAKPGSEEIIQGNTECTS